ncbi:MAG: glutaredoxin family protein [Gammaproteobacteria bacterium]|nr:glutaredoxin family protein [Gammaproteobacteria bacterium]
MLLKYWIFAFILASNCYSVLSVAGVYKWVDEHGNVHFTDKKPENQQARTVELKSSLNSYYNSSLPIINASSNTTVGNNKTPNRLPKLLHQQIIMYSTTWCTYCKKAKAYFKQNGLSFSERDIEKSKQAEKEYQSYGGGGVPLILVGNKKGTRKLSGFSVARFNAAYK